MFRRATRRRQTSRPRALIAFPAAADGRALIAGDAASIASETIRRMTTITGAHSILYSTNPEADRAFLRDVLGFPRVSGLRRCFRRWAVNGRSTSAIRSRGGAWCRKPSAGSNTASSPEGLSRRPSGEPSGTRTDPCQPAARRRARTGAAAARTARSSNAADSGRVKKTVGSPPAIAIARRNSCSSSGPRTTASTVGASGTS